MYLNKLTHLDLHYFTRTTADENPADGIQAQVFMDEVMFQSFTHIRFSLHMTRTITLRNFVFLGFDVEGTQYNQFLKINSSTLLMKDA